MVTEPTTTPSPEPTCPCRDRDPCNPDMSVRDMLRDANHYLNAAFESCGIGKPTVMHRLALIGAAQGTLQVAMAMHDTQAGAIGTELAAAMPVAAQAPGHMGMLAAWGNEPAPPLPWILRAVRRLISSRAMAIEAVAPEDAA